MTTEDKQSEKGDIKTSKAYKYIVGFVIATALLIFIVSLIFLVVRIVPGTISFVASVFDSVNTEPETELVVSETTILSGDTVVFAWQHDTSENILYSLTFLCEDQADLEISMENEELFCNETFFFDETTEEARVIFTSTAPTSVRAILEEERATGDIRIIDEVILTIEHSEIVVRADEDIEEAEESETPAVSERSPRVTSSPAPTQNTYTKETTFTPTRDLVTQVIAAGPTDSPNRFFIRFQVENRGNTATGSWAFRAILPTERASDRVFTSTTQSSLQPGAGIVYTLTFSDIQAGTHTALIQADIFNTVQEINESNNEARALFTATGVGGGSSSFNPNDDADFDIELIGYGRMSGSRFTETRNLDRDDDIAIRFRVRNIGGETTRDWRFDVNVDEPRGQRDLDFESRRYNELRPGESLDITIVFEDLDEDGEYEFEIEVDSERDTREETRRNNTLDLEIDIDR